MGGHLVNRLLRDGYRVTIVERYTKEKKTLLKNLFGQENLSVVWADVSSASNLEKNFAGIDWVFHLAGRLNAPDTDPLLFHRANVDGTMNVLEASRNAGVSRFIYPASASCYGDAKTYPTPETAQIQLKYPYALTKYIGEQYVLHWGRVYKLPVVSLRLFSAYGPRLHPQGSWGAVTPFMLQKLDGKPFQVCGDGNQTRDYVYIDDVIRAFLQAAESGITDSIFNIGTGKETTINLLMSLLGGKTEHLPRREGEIPRMCADIAQIQMVLGWKPVVTMEEGLRLVLKREKSRKRVAMTLGE